MLAEAAQLSLVIQAALISLSLGMVWYQMRQNAEIAKAANAQSLVTQAMEFSKMMLQNPEIAEVWFAPHLMKNKPNLCISYREFLIQWLIFHENIYYQYKKRLLDKDIYTSWNTELQIVLANHGLEVISNDIRVYFPGAFGEYLLTVRSNASRQKRRVNNDGNQAVVIKLDAKS
jgi:hypothetical protein